MIDHYEADVQTAQDYYPFGMIMPGRMFTALTVPGGSVSGTTQVNGFTVPVDLALTSRANDQPTQYVASRTIDLEDGFESSTNDDVTAYLADTSYAGSGNGGSGADGMAGAGKYRYGFNGKENDNEVKGIGDQIDYGMRVYDPRAGRFLSLDPLQAKYPWYSPYHFAGNKPIWAVDLDGREDYKFNLVPDKNSKGEPILRIEYTGRDEENLFEKKARQLTGTPDTYRLFYNGEQVGVFYSEQDMNSIAHGKTAAQLRKLEDERYVRGVLATGMVHGHEALKSSSSSTARAAGAAEAAGEASSASKAASVESAAAKTTVEESETANASSNSAPSESPILSKRARRREFAKDIFARAGKSDADVKRLLNTIDFNNGVSNTTLEVGEKVYRFEKFNVKDASEMHFFTDAAGTDGGPTGVGFGEASGYDLVTYEVTKKTTVMQSTMQGTKTKQFFSTELQNNIKKISKE